MVRVAAAVALGGSEGPDVSDDLARLARDDEPRVRAAAVRAVAHRLTVSTDADWREPGLAIVEGACADVAPVALAALDAVREIGAAAVGHTLGLLRRPEADVVREAVRCVGLHGDDTDLEEIVPLIAHADWSVRAEAIQTLASRRVQRSVPAILRRLDTEQDEYVRSVTLRALQRLDS